MKYQQDNGSRVNSFFTSDEDVLMLLEDVDFFHMKNRERVSFGCRIAELCGVSTESVYERIKVVCSKYGKPLAEK